MKTEFINKEKPRIANLLLILSQKVKDISPSAAGNSHSTHDKKDQTTFLKKAEPPKWTGDPIDFADFMRRWKSQVSTAKLPPESELDRLRENIPTQASKALFGEKEMKTAWKILENLYGDKDIIANKLKAQLKNIKIKGKVDHDIVIELVTDVNNIVLRLRAIEMEEILHVDSEFLSAVNIALPSDFKKDWLKFDKSCFRSKWAGFIKFLELARNQALQNKVLLTNYEQNDAKIICRKCGGSGHVAKECPTNTAKINNTNFNQVEETSEEKKKEKRKARDDCGNCPLCKGRHTYYRSRQKDQWPSDRLYRCEAFSNLSVKERAQNIEKFGCCPKCTAWSHKAADCKSVTKCGKMRNGNKCNAEHSFLLCGSGNAYCGALRTTFISSSSSSSSRDSSIADRSSSADGSSSSLEDLVFSESSFPDVHAETMLLFQDVKVLGADDPAKLCWDGGSTRCLVTHQYAKACRMHAQDIVYRLDVIGSQGNPEQGCYYQFEIVRNDGSVRKMWAYGIEKIMEPPEPIDLSSVRNLFPHLPGEIFLPSPKKPVDILVGNNFLQEHPSGGNGRDSVGDMRAYQSWYGSGWVLAGSHPSLIPGKSVLSTSAHHLARIYKCDIAPQLLPSFWEADCLGVLPAKRCGKCLRCLQCSDLGLVHSRKDQEELEMIKNGVKLVNGQLHVKYPFKRDPHCLPNNRNAVVRMAEKQEARLVKSGHLAYYNKEFLKYIDRGAVVKMSKQEMNDWKGPVNYISHHGVETDSVTTPRRIVTNSSLKNGTRSLNECLVRGPNSLNPMLNISLRFRCHDEGLVFDLTKAYNSLKTGPVEKNLRRFVWRFNPDDDWEDFAFDCVAFGDSPAANCLEIGRNMTADAGYEIDPVAAEKIKNDSYVDDNVSGGSKEEVERMKGERLADGSYSGTMRQILDVGNLKSKVFVSTGEADAAVKHLIGNKVLGYSWNATTDFMAVNFPVYLANKKHDAPGQIIQLFSSIRILRR